MRTALKMCVLGMAVLVGASACSGDDDEVVSTERPLTAAEASLLAEVLSSNYASGGASVTVATLDAPGGQRIDLAGEVDWKDLEGAAAVTVAAGNAPDAIGWTESVMMERWPSLDTVLTGFGAPPGAVIVRPPDMNRRLDQVVAVLAGLSSPRPENAALLAQTPGSAYLRDDTLRGIDVVVLRYGERSVYWLDADTGDMVRFEATNDTGGLPIVVDVLDRGERTVDLPPQSAWVPVEALEGIYESLGPTV